MTLNQLSKRRRLVGLLLVAILVMVGGLFYWAQKSGKIIPRAEVNPNQKMEGKIFDRQGDPIASAKVTDLKTGNYVRSSSDGAYNIANLSVGDVSLKYEKDGTIFNPNFSDVSTSNLFYKEIGAIKNAGITSGCTTTTYCPADPVTRGQMATFLNRSTNYPNSAATPQHPGNYYFVDVSPDSPHNNDIGWVYEEGITKGRDSTHYAPDDAVPRDEMAVFLFRALKLGPYDKLEPSFSDVSKTYWAYKEIEAVALEGIAMGYADGTYKPKDKITREQMAAFLTRAFINIPLTQGGYIPRIEKFYIVKDKGGTFDIYLALCGQVGKIEGVAKNTNGQAISGARVKITLQPSISEEYTRTTDSTGKFSFVNIPAGSYGYFISKPAGSGLYQTEDWENIVFVETGQTTALNLLNLQ